MGSAIILTVCFGGLGLIVWWRVLQCRTLGVPYMDGGRRGAFMTIGITAAACSALVGYALAFH